MKIDPYYFSGRKRFFDCALAVGLLAGLAPLLLLVGAVVAVTNGQPVLFRQKRLGKSGRVFTLYKFRTMQKNAPLLRRKYEHLNQAAAPMFKIHNDPRFVGVGWFLAHTGLDELPQLWNILRGEMSFVGPRPLPVAEARALPAPWRGWREQVRPGVFSEWTAALGRHESARGWKHAEQITLENGGLSHEIKIFIKTLKVTFLPFLIRKKA